MPSTKKYFLSSVAMWRLFMINNRALARMKLLTQTINYYEKNAIPRNNINSSTL